MRVFRRRRKDEEDDIIEGEIEEIAEDSSGEEAPPPAAPASRRWGFRRRTTPPAHTITTETPLERVAPDVPTPQEAALTPYIPPAENKRRLPNWLAWGEIRPGLLLVALSLIALGVFWTLHNRGQTSADLEAWWAAAPLAFGFSWAIYALFKRQAATFLAATALIGISLSLLLDAQAVVTWQETLVGSVLTTVGIGIMARGLLLRQGTVAS